MNSHVLEKIKQEALEQRKNFEQNVQQVSEIEDKAYPLSEEELEESKDSIYYTEGLMDTFSQELQNED